MNTKQYIVVLVILVMSLVLSGCSAGQVLGPAPTPTFDPSACPKVYLEKAVSQVAVDQPPTITTKLNTDGSVGAETKVIQGNILSLIDLNVFKDSPSIPSSISGATLRNDAPKIGDASAMFEFGGGMFQLQFVHHNVKVMVSFGFIDIFGSRNVDVVMNLAKSIDQALPSTGLPVQAGCVAP